MEFTQVLALLFYVILPAQSRSVVRNVWLDLGWDDDLDQCMSHCTNPPCDEEMVKIKAAKQTLKLEWIKKGSLTDAEILAETKVRAGPSGSCDSKGMKGQRPSDFPWPGGHGGSGQGPPQRSTRAPRAQGR